MSAYFEDLDRKYPESAFILTVRKDLSAWTNSCLKHFESKSRQRLSEEKIEIRRRLYGHSRLTKATLLRANARHESRVRRYFSSTKRKLLVIDITASLKDTAENLRTFLVNWWRGVGADGKKLCSVHARSALNDLAHCQLSPRFPHIRNHGAHRQASLCYVHLRDRLVLVAGHIERLLVLSQSPTAGDVDASIWVNRYAVVQGFRLNIYSSSKCVESRGSIKDVRACVVLPNARNRSIVLRRSDGGGCALGSKRNAHRN